MVVWRKLKVPERKREFLDVYVKRKWGGSEGIWRNEGGGRKEGCERQINEQIKNGAQA